MTIKWRYQEMIFTTIIMAIFLANFFLTKVIVTAEEINIHGRVFRENNIPFDYSSNFIWPDSIPILAFYLVYLFASLYLFPKHIEKKKFDTKFFLLALLAWLLLILVYAVCHYHLSLYKLNTVGFKQLRSTSINNSIAATGAVVIFYSLYLYIREFIITMIERGNNNRAFRVILTNKIMATLFICMSSVYFIGNQRFINKEAFAIFFLFLLLPSIPVCFINIFGVFPLQYKNKWGFKDIWWRLLITPTCIAFIILGLQILFKAEPGGPFAIWLIMVCISTPLSWLLFKLQNDKLEKQLQLHQVLGKTTADLQFLRSQINPHFLFNALNTLYGTALQENASRTAEGVQRLGDMMRFMLHENQQDKIHMSAEVEYLENYIALQKLRTQVSPNITIQSSIHKDYCNHEITPMLFIPFIENAFKHGISLQEKSWIHIYLTCDEQNVHFDIHNSLHNKKQNDTERNHSGIGLENVKSRLQLLYPDKHELTIRDNGREYFVHLTIKVK